MNIRHLVWGAALATLLNSPAQAARDRTPDEIAMLPPYCDAKMGRKTPESVSFWHNQMGAGNWVHIHHYCGGLIELNRYYRGAKGRKTPNLRIAVNEFTGMLNAFTPDFYLRPEVHLNRGKALKFMGRDGEALADFVKALELNPRLAPASIELADIYAKSGKKEQALAVLKKGLEQAPNTKSLRHRYQELGGDLKAIAEAPVVAPVAPSEPVKPEQVQAQPDTSALPKAAEAVAAPVIEQKIGNKTNPWCRFCPDDAAPDLAKPKAD
jgi:tetratricopeptide (TPR) repeat protein